MKGTEVYHWNPKLHHSLCWPNLWPGPAHLCGCFLLFIWLLLLLWNQWYYFSSFYKKMPGKKQLNGGKFTFGLWFQVIQSVMAGKAYCQELEMAGHITSIVRKQRVDKKWDVANKPQGPLWVTHFLQWGSISHRLHNLLGSNTNWGPSVQKQEPAENISHSSHSIHTYQEIACISFYVTELQLILHHLKLPSWVVDYNTNISDPFTVGSLIRLLHYGSGSCRNLACSPWILKEARVEWLLTWSEQTKKPDRTLQTWSPPDRIQWEQLKIWSPIPAGPLPERCCPQDQSRWWKPNYFLQFPSLPCPH